MREWWKKDMMHLQSKILPISSKAQIHWPSGLYFIEDLQVGRWGGGYRKKTTDTCGSDFIMTEKLKEYMDILIHRKKEFLESDIESSFSA